MRARQLYGVVLGTATILFGAGIYFFFWMVPESEASLDWYSGIDSLFRMPCAGVALLLVAYGLTLIVTTMRGTGPFG